MTSEVHLSGTVVVEPAVAELELGAAVSGVESGGTAPWPRPADPVNTAASSSGPRRIVGWPIDDNVRTELVTGALGTAQR